MAKKNVKVRDLKPNKDAKGGGHRIAGTHPTGGASGTHPTGGANTGGPVHGQSGFGGGRGGSGN